MNNETQTQTENGDARSVQCGVRLWESDCRIQECVDGDRRDTESGKLQNAGVASKNSARPLVIGD